MEDTQCFPCQFAQALPGKWEASATPALMVEGEQEYEVEDILAHEPKSKTKSDKVVKFLVKWTGYDHENNTWEPLSNMKNAPEALNEYWDRVAVQATQPTKGSGSGVALAGRRSARLAKRSI